MDDAFQQFPFAPQFLRPFVVLPDRGGFGKNYDFSEPFLFAIEVKDTSVVQYCANGDPVIDG